MKTDEADSKLATFEEVQKSTYTYAAKDYFQAKKDGVKVSSVKKLIWLLSAILTFSTILPQIFSERHRQEVTEEIKLSEGNHPVDGEIAIPKIQSEDFRRENNRQESSGVRKIPGKIKSIDLRTVSDPPPGAEVTAILVSGGANGTVKAKISQDLLLNNETYAHSGSILIGNGSSTDKRLYVSFNRLVSPEGKLKKIFAQAYDFSDHIRGIKGKKVSDQLFKIGASSALIFLSGLSESLQDQQSISPLGPQRKSLRDAAFGGVAQASSEHGKRLLDELNNDTQIEVQRETQIFVIFDSKEDRNDK